MARGLPRTWAQRLHTRLVLLVNCEQIPLAADKFRFRQASSASGKQIPLPGCPHHFRSDTLIAKRNPDREDEL
jgi:hypothetical protein